MRYPSPLASPAITHIDHLAVAIRRARGARPAGFAVEAVLEQVAFVRPLLMLKHVPMKAWNAGFLPGF